MAKSVGGTLAEQVQGGLVVDHKLVGSMRRFPEDENDREALIDMPTDAMVETICEEIVGVSQGDTALDAVGVAVPGLVKNGVIEEAPNLPQLKGARIAEMLSNQ